MPDELLTALTGASRLPERASWQGLARTIAGEFELSAVRIELWDPWITLASWGEPKGVRQIFPFHGLRGAVGRMAVWTEANSPVDSERFQHILWMIGMRLETWQLNHTLTALFQGATHDLRGITRRLAILSEVTLIDRNDVEIPQTQRHLKVERAAADSLFAALKRWWLSAPRNAPSEATLSGALSATQRRFRTALERRKVTLTVHDPVKLTLPCPEAHLTLALDEVVRNSLNFCPDPLRIHIECAQDEEYTRIRMRDNGEGVPADQVEKIFTPFYRLHAQSRGPGLGLAIVRRAAAVSGGFARCSNGHGGLTVEIGLPTRESAE